MVMLHSVEEWWISAATELDPLHVRPAAPAAGPAKPEQPLPNDGPRPNLSMMGRVAGSCAGLSFMFQLSFCAYCVETDSPSRPAERSCRLGLSVMFVS